MSGFRIFEWSGMRAVAPQARPGPLLGTQYHKGMEVARNHGLTCCATGICDGRSPGTGEFLTPGRGGSTPFPLGSHCTAASWTCGNVLCLEWNTPHQKRGKGRGSGLAHPVPSLLTLHSVASASQLYDMRSLAQFLKLPACLSTRPGEDVLPLHSYGHLATVFVPPLAWRTL